MKNLVTTEVNNAETLNSVLFYENNAKTVSYNSLEDFANMATSKIEQIKGTEKQINFAKKLYREAIVSFFDRDLSKYDSYEIQNLKRAVLVPNLFNVNISAFIDEMISDSRGNVFYIYSTLRYKILSGKYDKYFLDYRNFINNSK